jgi:predicted nucleotidyltransferase/predicted transcriptional regulator
MKVDRNASLAGVKLVKVRDFLRRYREGFYPEAIATFFENETHEAARITDELISAGYIAVDKDGASYSLTDLGMQLSNASFAKRISRAKAEELVKAVLARIDAINSRDELTHRVAAVKVFGSYLNDTPDLGDIDLAVGLTPRRDSHVEESIARADQFYNSPRTLLDRLFFGENEVRKLLKERQPHISLHAYDEPDKLTVPWKLLYSDPSFSVR